MNLVVSWNLMLMRLSNQAKLGLEMFQVFHATMDQKEARILTVLFYLLLVEVEFLAWLHKLQKQKEPRI